VLALLTWSLVAPWAAAQEIRELDSDTQAALDVLRKLTPQGQATALAGMEESRRDGELGRAQVTLLARLVDESAWTVAHRREVAFLLALLEDGAKGALNNLAARGDATAQQIARDALEFRRLVERFVAPQLSEREAACEDLAAFAEKHPESVTSVIAALATAYTRPQEPRRDIRVVALRALLRFGDRAAPALVETYVQPEPFYFQHTKAAFKSLDDKARESLLAGLNHRDPLVRQRVIYTLAELRLDAEAAAAIEPLQKDRDDLVRKAAVRVLADYRTYRRPQTTGR
jgi:HEAT repeat protein